MRAEHLIELRNHGSTIRDESGNYGWKANAPVSTPQSDDIGLDDSAESQASQHASHTSFEANIENMKNQDVVCPKVLLLSVIRALQKTALSTDTVCILSYSTF